MKLLKKTRCKIHALGQEKVSPLVRLWILRILVPLGGHKEFLDSRRYIDSEIAAAIGLGDSKHKIDDDDNDNKTAYWLSRLNELHQKAESRKARHPSPTLQKNLKMLQARLQLSEVEYQILEFAILLSSEIPLHKAGEMLKISSSGKLFAILSIILGVNQKDLRRALAPSGILRKSGLLSLDIGMHNDLTEALDLISSDFAENMKSSAANPVTLFRNMVLPGKPPQLNLADYPQIEQELSILVPYLKASSETGKAGVNILIHGMPGTGKTELARTLAKHLELALYEVATEDDDEDLLNGKERLRAFSASQAFFSQDKALILFDEAEDVFNDGSAFSHSTAQSHKAWINRMLEENAVPSIWLSNSIRGMDPAFLRRFDMVFNLPIAPKNQREKMIKKSSRGLLDAKAISQLAESEKLSPAVISRATSVIRMVRPNLQNISPGEAVAFLVNNTLEAQGHNPIRQNNPNRLPEVYDPAFINADVNLSEIAQGIIQTKSARLCLYGPPGTGKTAFGRWLAEQMGMPLHIKRSSDLMSMWVGGTEKNIARAFRAAERENAILLIDEVDSFLQDRRSAQRSWEVSQVNEMLTQMESFPGIFIASTNLMDGLDQASLRRFDMKTKFDFLKTDQAWHLLARYCRLMGLPEPGDILQKRLSRLHNLTPGDFAAVSRQSRFRKIVSGEVLVAALETETALKENSKPAIGFV